MISNVIALIDARFQLRKDESLSEFARQALIHRKSLEAQARWAFSNRQELIEFLSEETNLEEMIRHSMEQVKEFVYSRNQYLDLDGPARGGLYSEYREYYGSIRHALESSTSTEEFTGRLESDTITHLTRLSFGLGLSAARKSDRGTEWNPYLANVTCAEYSPERQLTMLHISTVADLLTPILDIGCGREARLCRHLRERGQDITGIDRNAPDLPYCHRIGWEEFDYGRESWGTIISHQSFSTHFHFHHNHSGVEAAGMAGTLMRILQGLGKGGRFAYAPGLPFIEQFIEQKEEFRVERRSIPEAPAAIQEIAYACHIVRKEG